jgi:hypothetical protein
MSLLAPHRIVAALALMAAGLALSAPPASAGPLGAYRAPETSASAVIRVHDRWYDDDDDYRHYKRRYYKRGYVRAPFTRVYTRGYRFTSVDAPFASVRVRPWGTWVRAPFVNIYVPRY